MDEIISLIVANGIFAVLFCGLLIYELKDSRARESKYMQTIRTLSDRLELLSAVKTDTGEIKSDTDEIKSDAKSVREGLDTVKRAVVKGGRGGGTCATVTA